MDKAEKQLLQYRNDLKKDEERLEELCKVEKGMKARADTKLLYIVFLSERTQKNKGKRINY